MRLLPCIRQLSRPHSLVVKLSAPLELQHDWQLPTLGPTDVRVRIAAAGVNYADLLQASPHGSHASVVSWHRQAPFVATGARAAEAPALEWSRRARAAGSLPSHSGLPHASRSALPQARGQYQVKAELPFVPGNEAAGEVSEIGERVSSLARGDKVIVIRRGGGLCGHVRPNAASALYVRAACTRLPVPHAPEAQGSLPRGATAVRTPSCARTSLGRAVRTAHRNTVAPQAAVTRARAWRTSSCASSCRADLPRWTWRRQPHCLSTTARCAGHSVPF